MKVGLSGCLVALLKKTRIVAVKEVVQNQGAIVVLKGSEALIVVPDGVRSD